MSGRLQGKVILVTGAAGGQGIAHARVMAAEGARLVLTDIDGKAVEALASQVIGTGGEAIGLVHDVTDLARWQAVAAAAMAKFGALHGLVNNAGIMSRLGIMEVPLDEWQRVLAANLTGPLYGMRVCAPLIRDSGGGSIVNVSSTAGLTAHFGAAYGSSKWGLRGLTKTAAVEFAPWGIRVNSIHPSIVSDTGMVSAGGPGFEEANRLVIPLGRPAQPHEVSLALVYLLSDESGYVTGAEMPIDGGLIGGGLTHVRKGMMPKLAGERK